MHRRDLLLAGVLAFTAPRQTAAQGFTPLGTFDDVRVSSATGEPHCYGYSLELWRHRGTIIGLLDRHSGLCGDPPCEALANVSHDPGSGRLDFSALSVTFVGTLRRDEVVGTLDGKRIRLVRDTSHRWIPIATRVLMPGAISGVASAAAAASMIYAAR